MVALFFFSSRRRHTRYIGDWSSDVCSSDLFLRNLSRIEWRVEQIAGSRRWANLGWGLTDEFEIGNSFEVLSVIGDQRNIVSNRARCDPQIVCSNYNACRQGRSQLSVDSAELGIIWDYDDRLDTVLQGLPMLRRPIPFLRPVVQLSNGNETYGHGLILDVRPIRVPTRVVFHQE